MKHEGFLPSRKLERAGRAVQGAVRKNPRTMTLAYRIWCYADPRGWDVTLGEIAEALGESRHRIQAIAYHRGWTDRFRVVVASKRDHRSGFTSTSFIDQLEDLHPWS